MVSVDERAESILNTKNKKSENEITTQHNNIITSSDDRDRSIIKHPVVFVLCVQKWERQRVTLTQEHRNKETMDGPPHSEMKKWGFWQRTVRCKLEAMLRTYDGVFSLRGLRRRRQAKTRACVNLSFLGMDHPTTTCMGFFGGISTKWRTNHSSCHWSLFFDDNETNNTTVFSRFRRNDEWMNETSTT